MEERVDPDTDEPEAEFERLQAKLDEVANDLAALIQQAERLVDEARRNRTVAPVSPLLSLERQESVETR